jgi:hypothetical protein
MINFHVQIILILRNKITIILSYFYFQENGCVKKYSLQNNFHFPILSMTQITEGTKLKFLKYREPT